MNNLLEKYNSLSNIKCNNKSMLTIKSHIMFQYLQRAMNSPLYNLPEELTSKSERCQWCLNKWTERQISMELKPEKHPKRSLYRLFKKDQSKLNKFQSKLVSKCKNQLGSNTLVLRCSTCRKETKIYIAKPKWSKKKKPQKNSQSQTKQNNVKKGKKNRKKDVYAGLKPSVFTGPLSKKTGTKHNYKGTKRPAHRYNKIRGNMHNKPNRISENWHNRNVGKKNSMVQDFLSLY